MLHIVSYYVNVRACTINNRTGLTNFIKLNKMCKALLYLLAKAICHQALIINGCWWVLYSMSRTSKKKVIESDKQGKSVVNVPGKDVDE